NRLQDLLLQRDQELANLKGELETSLADMSRKDAELRQMEDDMEEAENEVTHLKDELLNKSKLELQPIMDALG
ncbi:unnamed protein product, partial [Amoebophrya sp. A25]